MKHRRRVFFTDNQKSEIWDRWQRGESMNSIGRGFDRSSSSIYPLLALTGGKVPRVRDWGRETAKGDGQDGGLAPNI